MTTMTVHQLPTRFQGTVPNLAARRAAETPAAPADQFEPSAAGAAPPAANPAEARPSTSGGVSWVAGALALAATLPALGCVPGAASGPISQAITVESPQETRVDRGQAPISAEQKAKLLDASEAGAFDNFQARDIRSRLGQNVDRLLSEAETFNEQTSRLQQEGQRLERLGQNLGAGVHDSEFGRVEVQIEPTGMQVTQEVEGGSLEYRHFGDTVSLEVRHPDGRRETLQDTPQERTVIEGTVSRTLYLQDSLMGKAGTFEYTNATRSHQETLTIRGTRVERKLDQTVSGYAGRERISSQESFEVPGITLAIYPRPTLQYSTTTRTQNFTLEMDNSQGREVEIRQDGSTRTRQLNGDGLLQDEVIEPGILIFDDAPRSDVQLAQR